LIRAGGVTAFIRFYEELNLFLAKELRKKEVPCSFAPGTTVKKMIEDLGVPHTEVDLILVGGRSVPFEHRLRVGERISVYPVFESFDISAVSRVRPKPLRQTRFILDVHLGKLAHMLRIMGFDAAYSNSADDADIVAAALAEKRIILSRDRGLLKRKAVTHGCYVRSKAPVQQVREVVERFHLQKSIDPFSRCPECNAPLVQADREAVDAQVPRRVRQATGSFSQCPVCGKVYWRGSHWRDMAERLNRVLGFPVG